MSQMVGMSLKNAESAIELFEENNPGQLMAVRHLTQREHEPGGISCVVIEAIRTTHPEEKGLWISILVVGKELGELL